jgi:DNA-binding response OmpR family regulator
VAAQRPFPYNEGVVESWRYQTLRVLVVEDDEKTASFLLRNLQEEGFDVDKAGDGKTGLRLALAGSYDAIVVDIMLPKLDGLSVIQELRRKEINTPVIILSAKRSVDDRVKGLQKGSDDYLTKPFAFSELLARLQALIRRATGAAEPTRLTAGDLTIDLLKREFFLEDKKIDLQPREFDLLKYLIQNAGKVMSKTLILERIWGYGFDPQTNVVDVLVCRLRNKVDKDFNTKKIHTVRGVGYVLKVS